MKKLLGTSTRYAPIRNSTRAGSCPRSILVQGIQSGQDIGGLLGRRGREIAPDDFAGADQEGLSGGETPFGGDSESADDCFVLIGQQGEREVVFLLEFFLGLGGIVAHPDHGDTLFGQDLKIIPQAAGLFGASRGVRLGVEIDQHISARVKITQGDGFTILIEGCYPGGFRANFEGLAGAGEELSQYCHRD